MPSTHWRLRRFVTGEDVGAVLSISCFLPTLPLRFLSSAVRSDSMRTLRRDGATGDPFALDGQGAAEGGDLGAAVWRRGELRGCCGRRRSSGDVSRARAAGSSRATDGAPEAESLKTDSAEEVEGASRFCARFCPTFCSRASSNMRDARDAAKELAALLSLESARPCALESSRFPSGAA